MSKAARYYNSIKVDRQQWKKERLAEFGFCWVCGQMGTMGMPLEVHEMAKRSAAPNKWGERCNYFLCCNACNLSFLNYIDVKYQLALKMIRDPLHFDAERVSELRGRARSAVTEDDIRDAIVDLAVGMLHATVSQKRRFDVRSAMELLSNLREGRGVRPVKAEWEMVFRNAVKGV